MFPEGSLGVIFCETFNVRLWIILGFALYLLTLKNVWKTFRNVP